jgi:dCTP deaminase
MILTGSLIKSEVECKRITINPFKEDNIEPNSYGFRLARDLIMFDENQLVDAARPTK